MNESVYPIGTPGTPWGEAEKSQWLALQTIKRSYQEEVLKRVNSLLDDDIEAIQYGALSIDEARYPLVLLKTKNWQQDKPTVLVTGGVHGYETSGVQGAIRFVKSQLAQYHEAFNFIVAPCVSPWGYESINRWNVNADDPNRNFFANSIAPECALLMAAVEPYLASVIAHIDLHETTDTDNSEFRPAKAAKDAIVQHSWNIPDGFYLVADSQNPQPDFQKAIIDAVAKVTHIAPADEKNQLIGVDISQFGVIEYDAKPLGLCMGLTDAKYKTTTEVYPDSPLVDDENCILAQVEVLTSALDFILSKEAT